MKLEAYARIMVELAGAGDRRAEVLARYDLDEDAWEEADTAWQDRLSEAMNEDDSDGVPDLVAQYTKAYEEAQRADGVVISLEAFAKVTRLLGGTSDLRAALAKAGVTLSDYVRATEHYSRRFALEPELAERFDHELRAR